MKRRIFMFALVAVLFAGGLAFASCGKQECKEVQLMGAGDRIHDSYTFANTGVVLTKKAEDEFEISGSVKYLADQKVKEEFDIDADVNHVVALKLSNCSGNETKKDEVQITIDGVRNYDAEHLNGDDYTFVILEAVPGNLTTIKVKWNSEMQEITYKIKMADELVLDTPS